MKRIIQLITLIALICGTAFAGTVTLGWTNNEPMATGTRIYWTTTPSVYMTNVFVEVPYGTNTVTISNLVSGTRYWFTARHVIVNEVSDCSNEVDAQTLMGIPTFLEVQAIAK